MIRLALPLVAAALLACDGDAADTAGPSDADTGTESDTSASADAASDAAADAGSACLVDERVVSLTTSDGLVLAADWQDAPAAGRGAVVLLHMIPPANDRTSYPPRVRQRLAELGVTVVNLDRRGAGDSEGTAQDAYLGDGGRLDVEAVVTALAAAPCTVDTDRIVLVGASNGSTSVWDYAVAHDPALPAPAGIALFSPGTYTEAQHPFADHRDVADALPMLWLYPDTEPYSAGFVDGAPDMWTFVEIAGGVHGTGNFDDGALEATAIDALVGFVGE